MNALFQNRSAGSHHARFIIAVLLTVSCTSCLTHYQPRASERVQVIDAVGVRTWAKDGRVVTDGLFGGGLYELVKDQPRARNDAVAHHIDIARSRSARPALRRVGSASACWPRSSRTSPSRASLRSLSACSARFQRPSFSSPPTPTCGARSTSTTTASIRPDRSRCRCRCRRIEGGRCCRRRCRCRRCCCVANEGDPRRGEQP